MDPRLSPTLRHVTCLALLGLSLAAPAVAQAGIALDVAITVPSSMPVGTTGAPASLSVTNTSASGSGESGYETDSLRVTALTAVLSCGSAGVTDDCPFGLRDGGVIVPSATATGRALTACAGVPFSVAQVGAAVDGKYALQPATQVVLGPSPDACIVDFTVSVARVPAIDSSAGAGLQTMTAGYARVLDLTGAHAGQTGAGLGTATVTVSPAQPSIATQAAPNTPLGQAPLTDQATVSGLANPVPGAGAVEFRVYGPDDATCASPTATFSGVPLTLNGPGTAGTAVSPGFNPAASGMYRWRAFYSGDANNAPVSGACNAANESTFALRAQPSLVTQASPSIPLGGGALSDQATLTGLVSPVAGAGAPTVEFRLYGPNDPTCLSPIATYANVALALNGAQTQGTAVSPSFTPPTIGTYRWRAFFSGDVNNAGSSGLCDAPDESTVVYVPQSSIETVASPGIVVGAGSLTDKATVSGLVNPGSGTVEFRLYGPDDATCATLVESFPGVALTYDAGQATGTATSPPFTPTAPGTYRWRAFYSGDANNVPASAPCNAPNESVTVTTTATPPPAPPPPPPPPGPSPGISTLASAGVVLGGQVRDTATVTGRLNPAAGSTVEFRLYGPDDATCASAPAFTSTVALSEAGTATSAPFTPTRAGTYRWRAFYSGDANNPAASGFCNAPGERVVVAPPDGPQIAFAGFAAPPRAGSPARLVVTASDPARPISGVRVRFGEPSGLVGISGCIAPTLALAPTVVRQRVVYTFRRPGPHVVEVTVLSGGCAGPQLRTTATLAVTVAPRASTSARPRAARRAASPAVGAAEASAGGCQDSALTLTPTNRVRVAAAVLCLVNAERRARTRKPLLRAARLERAAAAHSTDMFRRAFFAHERTPGGPSLVTRLRGAGYRGPTYAENIAYASDATATDIVDAWMSSPPQRANILHVKVQFAGVGLAAGIPDSPARPGATFTLDLGGTAR